MGQYSVSKENHGRRRHTEMESVLNVIRHQLCLTPDFSRLVLLPFLNTAECLLKFGSLIDEISQGWGEVKKAFRN
jgi:hypothetical protein